MRTIEDVIRYFGPLSDFGSSPWLAIIGNSQELNERPLRLACIMGTDSCLNFRRFWAARRIRFGSTLAEETLSPMRGPYLV